MTEQALREAHELYGEQWSEDWQAAAKALLRDFEQHGIHLSNDRRELVQHLHEEINQVRLAVNQKVNWTGVH
jgi:Zn-dependent oligopeptidase